MQPIISRSIRVPQLGGPEVLKFIAQDQTLDPAALSPTQVIVKHAFAGINFIDTYVRSGLYPAKEPNYIPGTEGCGTVLFAGKNVPPEFSVGKKVAFFQTLQGSYTSHAIHNFQDLVAVPPQLYNSSSSTTSSNNDADLAVTAMLIQGITAHYLSSSCFPVSEKTQTVLLNAAAGGTGSLLSQMCKLRGAKKVIGVCGGPEKAKLAKEVGKCDEVIDYKTNPDWVAQVKLLAPEGVDVFYDSVGKSTFEKDCFSVLKRRGAMITFGNASGPVPPLAPLTLTKYGSISLQRPKMFDFVDRASGELDERMNEITQWIVERKLTLSISKVLKLEDAAEAHRLLESGTTTGKLLLDCQA
jgi:NADPH2:quinone reductase